MKIYKFRNCLLNSLERTALRDGKRLDLTPKTFDVLQMLVERAGELVTKDEILGNVWNGSFVEEGNLPVHVAKLRRQLDGDGNNRFIETVHGGGYRFTANVEVVGDDVWQKQFAGFNRRKTDRQPEQDTFDSIAVLPLRNETNDVENDYLADGLTESLINRLSRTTNLRVMARDTVFRYKNKDADAKEVGDTLGVSAVLTGRVKLVKENLLIGVELVKVADGSQLWGEQFDQPFSDIIKIKDSIASTVTEQLRSRTSRFAASPQHNAVTKNAESYRLYLKGKYFQEKHTESDLYKAIDYFQESVLLDAQNIHSRVEIVESFFLLFIFDYISYADVRTSIKPTMSILNEIGDCVDVYHSMSGAIKMTLDRNFDEADSSFQKAISLNPHSSFTLTRFSQLLLCRRKFEEALQCVHTILVIDPLSLNTLKRLGRILYCMEHYERALGCLADAHEMEPLDYETHLLFGAVMAELGNYASAIEAFQSSLEIEHNVDAIAMKGYVYALEGKRDQAVQTIKELQSPNSSNEHSIKIAQIYAVMGETKRAFLLLERAIKNRESDVTALTFDPRWKRLRDMPRFQNLLDRIGVSKKDI